MFKLKIGRLTIQLFPPKITFNL